MDKRKEELLAAWAGMQIERNWRWLVVATWLIFCAIFIYQRWAGIQGFALGDTDDNLRMSQVRALLGGQDWFDLRQYRLNPPQGADVHWSRLVDLPLAGLILMLRPLFGGAEAERIAVTIAPLLPLLVMLFGVALTARRLIDPRAYPMAIVALFFAGSTTGMFMPTRIDHHGWQLAFLSLAVAGLADPKRARGGATLGAATALSLAVGLELLIYLAIAGAATVLFWIDSADQRRRLATYAATAGGGTALAYLLFASHANREPLCDALSPVWLSNAMLGAALLLALAFLTPGDWKRRLALAAGAGLIVAAFHALSWPHCLSRLEGVSPEVERLWLSYVREARPVYRHGWDVAPLLLALPITGLLGWGLLSWRNRRNRDLLRRTLAVALPALAAMALLFWQTRTAPAAQMLAAVGAIAIIWILAPLAWRSSYAAVRILGVTSIALVGLGAVAPLVSNLKPQRERTEREIAIARANRLCNSLYGLKPIAQQPKGMVFTFVDLGPRLITVTHHTSVTGPYHRNGEQIADVMKAFRGDEAQARAIIAGKYRSDYLLTCPMSSTHTIFMSEARDGFYGRLERGQVPGWLERVELPEDSPFKLWRVSR